jgi:hypothetical protein
METIGRHLVDHWSWAAEKGLMNPSTAAGRKSACVQVLSILEDWENMDISQLDVDNLLRFQNLKKKEFRPNVLEVYKKRFIAARESYLDYLQNPGGWRSSSQDRPAKESGKKGQRGFRIPQGANLITINGAPCCRRLKSTGGALCLNLQQNKECIRTQLSTTTRIN